MQTTAYITITDQGYNAIYGAPNILVGLLVCEASKTLKAKVGYYRKHVTLECPKTQLEKFIQCCIDDMQFSPSFYYGGPHPFVIMLATGDVDTENYVVRACERGWQVLERVNRNLIGQPGFNTADFGLRH